MTLSDTLHGAGFVSALVIDDAFDTVPKASDLSMDGDAWSIFIADIGADAELIRTRFESYDAMDANQLRESDEFVAVIYGMKDEIADESWNRLFDRYERDRGNDRAFLNELCRRLSDAGLRVLQSGRRVPDEGRGCNIVFADLFLGAAQKDFDVDASIKRLQGLVDPRASSPPAVVLMSGSGRLREMKERFRDDARMVGALFRVYQKPDLLKGTTVETVLERFATHYADGVRVAAFLSAWEAGLKVAGTEFMKLIRRLDLSDYGKIREVLLDAEGQPLGSYMLDVFDRVLQHQIEGHAPTIAAAQSLDSIDATRYPAPYIAGSVDLQDFVIRSLWQNGERLRVAGNTAGMPVSFGDVLVRGSRLADPGGKPPVDQPDALVVLTPACDLVRKPDRRVLLVGGELRLLDSKTWRYKTSGVTTPVVQLPGQSRMSIVWDLEDQRMLTKAELAALIADHGPYQAKLRLRESNALEIQQDLLSQMGRVGTMSKMPFTFPVDVIVSIFDKEGGVKPLELPITIADGGVCIIGRDQDGNDLPKLILTETAVDEILEAIPLIQAGNVNERSIDALKRLQDSAPFRSELRSGLRAPWASQGNLVSVKYPGTILDSKGKPKDETVALIVRNPGKIKPSVQDLKSAAIVIMFNDREPEAAAMSAAAASEEKVSTEEVAPF